MIARCTYAFKVVLVFERLAGSSIHTRVELAWGLRREKTFNFCYVDENILQLETIKQRFLQDLTNSN